MDDLLFTTMTAGIILFIVLFIGVLLLITAIGRWKIFSRCGIEGWKAIVPFYSTYLFLNNLCGLHWGFTVVEFLFMTISTSHTVLVEIVRIIINGFAFYNFAKKIHKDEKMIGIFGGFFPTIMSFILGFFTGYDYDPYQQVSPFGPIDDLKK